MRSPFNYPDQHPDVGARLYSSELKELAERVRAEGNDRFANKTANNLLRIAAYLHIHALGLAICSYPDDNFNLIFCTSCWRRIETMKCPYCNGQGRIP